MKNEGASWYDLGGRRVPFPHKGGIYSIGGQRTDKLQKGLNIIRYSDGSSRKVMVK